MTARPNLLLFMPDQLRADALGCFGNPVASTPAFDALAARGTRFTDAWSQHSVCGPSRVSMMTGWYPHVAGHRTLDNLLAPTEPNLMRLLHDAGYHVAIAGNRGDVFASGVTEASSDFCGFLVEPSQDDLMRRFTSEHDQSSALFRAMCFGSGGDSVLLDYDEAVVRTAEQWIAEAAPRTEPWALWVPLMFPHPPFTVEEPWFSLHDRSAMSDPLPPTKGKPAFMEAYRRAYGWDALTVDDFHEITAIYYGMVSRVDSQLGRLVDALDETGLTERTIVAAFTDHGEYLGDYGLVEKWPSGLDPCLLRNPLILAGPAIPEGTSIDQPVEMIDLLPTLCEIAGAEIRHTHFGRSLVPVLADPTVEHRPFACAEGGFRPSDTHLFEGGGWIYQAKTDLQQQRPELVGLALALRTPTHTYVYRGYEGDELYDRVADPSETRNLLDPDDPASTDGSIGHLAADLRSMVLQWLTETSDVIPWEADPRFPEIPNGYR